MNPDYWASKAVAGEPGQYNRTLWTALLRVLGPVLRVMYRPVFIDEKNLPKDRPYLLVANHSGGMGLAEIICFIYCFVQNFGYGRKLSALAHPFGFVYWPINVLLRSIGAVPSTYDFADQVLNSKVPLLVFPGGDYECTRPVWQYKRVDFHRRCGFLRIAKKANVPIVPLGISGSHLTAPIIWRSSFILPKLLIIPALFGIKRFPLTLLGLVGAILIAYFGVDKFAWWTLGLIWLWFVSLIPFVPFVPAKIHFRFGEAISPEDLFSDEDPGLQQAHDTVVRRVQELVLASYPTDSTH